MVGDVVVGDCLVDERESGGLVGWSNEENVRKIRSVIRFVVESVDPTREFGKGKPSL